MQFVAILSKSGIVIFPSDGQASKVTGFFAKDVSAFLATGEVSYFERTKKVVMPSGSYAMKHLNALNKQKGLKPNTGPALYFSNLYAISYDLLGLSDTFDTFHSIRILTGQGSASSDKGLFLLDHRSTSDLQSFVCSK